MQNRLKIVRKERKITQQAIAEYVGISQNAYSYWENGKTKIDNESLAKIADFLKVSIDFLSGRDYTITIFPERWRHDLYEDYLSADEPHKVWMEYLYGNLVFAAERAEKALDEMEITMLENFRKLDLTCKCKLISLSTDWINEKEKKIIAENA